VAIGQERRDQPTRTRLAGSVKLPARTTRRSGRRAAARTTSWPSGWCVHSPICGPSRPGSQSRRSIRLAMRVRLMASNSVISRDRSDALSVRQTRNPISSWVFSCTREQSGSSFASASPQRWRTCQFRAVSLSHPIRAVLQATPSELDCLRAQCLQPARVAVGVAPLSPVARRKLARIAPGRDVPSRRQVALTIMRRSVSNRNWRGRDQGAAFSHVDVERVLLRRFVRGAVDHFGRGPLPTISCGAFHGADHTCEIFGNRI
jgi:hypothetical protein